MTTQSNSDRSLEGKIVMVTGANAGMGKEISLALAGKGASLVMVCRDRARGEAARADVQEKTGNRTVELMVADLSLQSSIRNLVKEFEARHDRLNVLVNNAGITMSRRETTLEGVEVVFATNHLGPFLLTNLLLPVLTAGAPSRVVTVSSAAHAMGRMDFADPQGVVSYNEIRVYNQSKLANVLFTYELARRIAGTGVSANVVEPGFVKTNMKVPFPFSLFSFMRRPAADGAKPTVFVASSPEVAGVTGSFFNVKGVMTRSSQGSYDVDSATKLWELSAKLTNLDSPEAAC